MRLQGRIDAGRREADIVGGAKFFIGAGGADFHAIAGEGVKKKRRAPTVGEFAGGVDRGVVARQVGQAIGIFADKSGGDLGVFAEGGDRGWGS